MQQGTKNLPQMLTFMFSKHIMAWGMQLKRNYADFSKLSREGIHSNISQTYKAQYFKNVKQPFETMFC